MSKAFPAFSEPVSSPLRGPKPWDIHAYTSRFRVCRRQAVAVNGRGVWHHRPSRTKSRFLLQRAGVADVVAELDEAAARTR